MRSVIKGLLRNKVPGKFAESGQGSVELVMSILLFVAMLGTLISLSLYMYVNHTFLTAAKEGARRAAVESNLANATTYSTGEASVKQWVKDFVSSSSGIQLTDAEIALSGPTGATVGERTVVVTITHNFQNPIQIREFINHLGGGSETGLDTFTISNTATMRYEE